MYRPLFRPQYPDPTTTMDWSNCTMASGAMALDFHTLGKVQKWGGELRKHQSDQTGGTDIGDLKQAWAYYGYTLVDRRGKDWNQLVADLKSGRGVVLQGDYEVLTGADSCQTSFDGDHAIYLNPQFYNGNLNVAVGDPLCKAFKQITMANLKKYAEKLGRATYGTTSPQKILYATTAAHPDPVVPPPAPKGEEMIIGENLVRTSDHFVKVAKGTVVYKDPACTVQLTTMSEAADLDYMGTAPDNTVCWAVEIATGRIVSGKMLPVIAYVKRAGNGAPTKRPVTPDNTIYTQQQLDAAVAAAVAKTKSGAKAVQTLEVTFE